MTIHTGKKNGSAFDGVAVFGIYKPHPKILFLFLNFAKHMVKNFALRIVYAIP